MSDNAPVSDAVLVGALRPFVRAARPVLRVLRESDLFGLRERLPPKERGAGGAAGEPGSPAEDGTNGRSVLGRGLDRLGSGVDKALDAVAAVRVPGTAAWAAMSPQDRQHWWIYRVGRFGTAVAAVPGLGGALARTLPVSAVIGAADQGILLIAIAGEHGVTDENRLVELLACVLFDRDIRLTAPPTQAEDAAADREAAELTADLDDSRAKPVLRQVAGLTWRLGRVLLALEDELDKRPHGRFYHEWLGLLPVVGVAGKYLGEWSGLKRAARMGERWLAERDLLRA